MLLVIIALSSSTALFAYFAVAGTNTGYSGLGGSSLLSPNRNSALLAGTSQQAGDPAPNSITVGGAGSVSYIPNEALIRVAAVTENKSAVLATSSNAALSSKVIKALNGAGVSNSSIQTQGYNLNVVYSNCFNNPPCVPQIMGYTVSNNLMVNLTSTSPTQLGSQVGTVIDAAVEAGANQVSLSFSETNSGLAALSNNALQRALATASGQAKVIATSLGVSITGVISASEGSSSGPQNFYGPVQFGAIATVTTVAGAGTPIIPGSQSYTINVQVVYAIT